MPFPTGSYSPTVYEFLAIAGVFGFAIAAYLLFMKFFPIVEFPHIGERQELEQ
jgi:Ni/Fe-hydrogenase subunit HybB-like protein